MGVVFLAVSTDGTGNDTGNGPREGAGQGAGQGVGDDLAAVKVIRREYSADREFRARFASEVELARRVRGPYTARVLDADTDGRHPWLATEYVPGPSLHEAVRDSGPFPEPSLRALAAGLAEALAAIHGVGLIHRDLKPSNVLLSPCGPQVIDFGIARAADATALTRTGQTLGTPAYMSPEQAIGSVVDPRSDLFSFGGVLLFTATGRQPFGTGSAPALLYRVVNEEPDLSGVPEALRPLVTACLAKDPGDRPELGSVLDQLTGTALPRGDEDPTEWLPEAVATRVLRTTAAATATVTRVVPTLAVTSKAVPEEDAPQEAIPEEVVPEEVVPEEAAAPAEPAPAESTPAEPTGEAPAEAAPSEAPSPEPQETEAPAPQLAELTTKHESGHAAPERSGPTWPWAAAAVAVILMLVLIALVTDDQAPGARPDSGHQEGTASTPSPSPSPTPSPDEPEPEIMDTVFLGGSDRFAVRSAIGVFLFETGRSEATERLTTELEGARLSDSELATTPDGSTLAAVTRNGQYTRAPEILLWDLDESEKYTFELPRETNGNGRVALSPDGRTLFFASRSHKEVTAYSRSGEELFRASLPANERGTTGRVNALATSPDGELLFATMHTGLAVLDATTGEKHPSYPELREASTDTDSSMEVGDGIIVTGTYRSVQLWDMYSDEEPEEFLIREGSTASGARLQQLALGNGGNRIYASGHDSDRNLSFLTVWDEEGNVLTQAGTGAEYLSLSASSDGEQLLVSSLPLDRQEPEEFVLLDRDLEPVEEFTMPTLQVTLTYPPDGQS